jgi:hypothetical protein
VTQVDSERFDTNLSFLLPREKKAGCLSSAYAVTQNFLG